MTTTTTAVHPPSGGRFDFDDGGTYCGGWEDGKAHGHGVCTGPKGQGEYCGSWLQGFEVCGVYTWPTGHSYEGEWTEGKRHGLGVETRGRWIYRGDWTNGFKGKYGVRQCISSGAKYDGTWANGLQDGYGSETYADGGTFQGQWVKGMRHGYGVRSSAPFGLAAFTRNQSLKSPPSDNPTPEPRRPEESRGGFVLKSKDATLGRSLPDHRPKGSSLKKLFRSKHDNRTSEEEELEEGGASGSEATDSSFVVQEDEVIDGNVIETYGGEWKNDRRNGFGIAERSDGIKYEGEWYNNKKFGYGRTIFKNGTEELGKYKNNVLIASGMKKHIFSLHSKKFRARVEAAVAAAHRSFELALGKADTAISRTATARGQAEQADAAAKHARRESEIARAVAKQYAPEFQPTGSGLLRRKFASSQDSSDFGQFHHNEDLTHRSSQPAGNYYPPPKENQYLQPEFDDYHLSPAQSQPQPSSFLDLFKNNPDRRPSAAGFLRRPSTVNLRRPSTVVELSIVPSLFNQQAIPNNPHRPQLSLQQVVDEHFQHYYETNKPSSRPTSPNKVKKPAIDLTELSKLYGIPLSHPKTMEDEEEVTFIPQRRSTMPTVLDQNSLQVEADTSTGEAMVRTGSLYSATRKMESSSRGGSIASSRKKSLPDISNISEPRILTREAVAILSSQRREAIRRQEEEAQRLRANPLLYLLSPEFSDWLAGQQLVILVLVINIAIGILFFKVIL